MASQTRVSWNERRILQSAYAKMGRSRNVRDQEKNDHKTEWGFDYSKYTSCNRQRASLSREQVPERICLKMKIKNRSICRNIMLHFSSKTLHDTLYCDKSTKSLLLINTSAHYLV